jgi:hypothetical protein
MQSRAMGFAELPMSGILMCELAHCSLALCSEDARQE